MKFKETAFLGLMAAFASEAAWHTRYTGPTAVPRQGDFIHFNVDTTAGKRMAGSPWFTKTSIDSLKFDDLVAQAENSTGGDVMREETNKDNALMPNGPACIFRRVVSGYPSPGDTSWEVTAFSADASPSVHADYFIRGATGRASQFGKGTTASLPLILESKPLGFRDSTPDAWIHYIPAPFEPQLPGTHDKTATAYGTWIVAKDQKGTFYSTREGYEKVPFTRYRVEMRIDSVLVWEANGGSALVGKKVTSVDPAYEFFRTRYAKQRLFYFNPEKGVFLKLSEFVDVDYLKWDVYFYFLDKEVAASMGSNQAAPKPQLLGQLGHDALGRRMFMMNTPFPAGLLQ